MTMRIPLTTTAVQNALCPPGKAKIDLPVIGHANLALRVYATGTKAFYMLYRVGSGRKAQKRADKIPGDATALAIKDVKDAWRAKLGAIAKGGDPAGERKAEAKRERNRIEPALGAYERDLTRRKVVKRDEVMSLLRRELQTPFGNVDLASLTRVVSCVDGSVGARVDSRIW